MHSYLLPCRLILGEDAVKKVRALYMGELRKNTTSTGTITKKKQVTLEILRLLAQKKIFYEVNFFHFLIKLNSSLI